MTIPKYISQAERNRIAAGRTRQEEAEWQAAREAEYQQAKAQAIVDGTYKPMTGLSILASMKI